jgi:hypothetical protein
MQQFGVDRSFRQPGLAQGPGIFGIVFRPAKNSDPMLEIGQAHVGIELERASNGLLRLLLPAGESIAGRGNAQRGQDVRSLP